MASDGGVTVLSPTRHSAAVNPSHPSHGCDGSRSALSCENMPCDGLRKTRHTRHKLALKRPNRSDVRSRHKAVYGSCGPRPCDRPTLRAAITLSSSRSAAEVGRDAAAGPGQVRILGMRSAVSVGGQTGPLGLTGWSGRGAASGTQEGELPVIPGRLLRPAPSRSRHCQCHTTAITHLPG